MAWRLVVEDEAQYRAMLAGNTEVLKFVGVKFGGGDLIEVTDDASTFFALLYVRLAIGSQVGNFKMCDVAELIFKKLGDEDVQPTETGSWNVMYRGPFKKWCVVSPDGVIASSHMQTREEALVDMNNRSGPSLQKTFHVNY